MANTTNDRWPKITAWMLMLLTSIVVAGIPWAVRMERELSSTRTGLENLNRTIEKLEVPPGWFIRHVDSIDRRVQEIERGSQNRSTP